MAAAHAAQRTRWAMAGIGAMLCAAATGCQVDIGGQTLPSPYYQQDDIQYFPAGPEFKLSREAAALKEAKIREQRRLGLRGPAPASTYGPAPGVGAPAPEAIPPAAPTDAPPPGAAGVAPEPENAFDAPPGEVPGAGGLQPAPDGAMPADEESPFEDVAP